MFTTDSDLGGLGFGASNAVEAGERPINRNIDVAGVTLHFTDVGTGTPVVFLHGNGSMSAEIAASGIVDLLSQQYRIIVFDRPGYGLSSRPVFRSWTIEAQADLLYKALWKIGVERPVLVGHSLGALIALAMCLRNRNGVRGLVLISGFYFVSPPSAAAGRLYEKLMKKPGLVSLGFGLNSIARRLLSSLILRVFSPQQPTKRFLLQYSRTLALRRSHIVSSFEETFLMLAAAWRLAPHYRDVSLPAFIFAGTRDSILHADEHALELHSKIEHSKLVLLPGMGHMLHHFAQRMVVSAVDLVVHWRICGCAPTDQCPYGGR